MMDMFADVSGGEVIHCTTLVYFGSFLCLPKALLCLTVLHHNLKHVSDSVLLLLFKCQLQSVFHWCVA